MRYIFLILLLVATQLRAEPLRVVTTIAPLHGIISDLMRGVAEPVLIVTEGTDPHHFSLSPSQVSTLLNADVIFAMGGGMEPWLDQVEMGPETKILYFTGFSMFTSPPAPNALGLSVRSLSQVGTGHQQATPESIDPHFWLHEFSANAMISGIIEYLVANRLIPSAQSRQITQNYRGFVDSFYEAEETLAEVVDALGDTPIVTTHDSLQYLQRYHGINIVGALSSVTGEQAGARSLGRLSNIEGPVCLMIDVTEAAPGLVALFPDWTHVRYDPMGYKFAGQPDYLSNLYLSIAAALESCITAP